MYVARQVVTNSKGEKVEVYWNAQAFEDLGNPAYYGDIYSFLVRMGGRARRKNFEGVVVMKQANAA